MAIRTPIKTPKRDAAQNGAASARMGGKGAPKPHKGGVTRVAHRLTAGIYGFFARANHLLVMGGMFAGVFGRMKGVKGIGGAFGFAERLVAGVDDATRAQSDKELPKQITVTELGGMLSPSRLLKRVLGDKGAKAQEGVSAVEGSVLGAVGRAASGVSETLGKGVENNRGMLIDPSVRRIEAGAARHADKAQGLLADMVASSKGNAALSGVNSSLAAANAALKSGNNEAYVEAMGQAQTGLKNVTGVDKKTLKSISSGIKKAGSAAEKSGQRNHVATKLKDLPGAIGKAPETFKQASVQGVVMKGALITGTALQVTGTARGLSENIGTLKDLYTDLTGEKKISTRKLLFGKNVPDIVKEARGQMLKQYGPRVVLDAANTAMTVAFSVMKHNGLSLHNKNMKLAVGNMGLMAAGQLYQAKAQEGFLPIYDAVSQMPKLEGAQYAALISSASKQAAKIGGMESELIQTVSVQYAREGLRPVEVLKEIENGRFDERCLRIMQQSRNAMQAPSNGPAAMNREVVGAHTQRLQDEARSNTRTLH